jgi:hypothetical protein
VPYEDGTGTPDDHALPVRPQVVITGRRQLVRRTGGAAWRPYVCEWRPYNALTHLGAVASALRAARAEPRQRRNHRGSAARATRRAAVRPAGTWIARVPGVCPRWRGRRVPHTPRSASPAAFDCSALRRQRSTEAPRCRAGGRLRERSSLLGEHHGLHRCIPRPERRAEPRRLTADEACRDRRAAPPRRRERRPTATLWPALPAASIPARSFARAPRRTVPRAPRRRCHRGGSRHQCHAAAIVGRTVDPGAFRRQSNHRTAVPADVRCQDFPVFTKSKKTPNGCENRVLRTTSGFQAAPLWGRPSQTSE